MFLRTNFKQGALDMYLHHTIKAHCQAQPLNQAIPSLSETMSPGVLPFPIVAGNGRWASKET